MSAIDPASSRIGRNYRAMRESPSTIHLSPRCFSIVPINFQIQTTSRAPIPCGLCAVRTALAFLSTTAAFMLVILATPCFPSTTAGFLRNHRVSFSIPTFHKFRHPRDLPPLPIHLLPAFPHISSWMSINGQQCRLDSRPTTKNCP